jgi:hypothetical protein
MVAESKKESNAESATFLIAFLWSVSTGQMEKGLLGVFEGLLSAVANIDHHM